jgi:hypothetical protein
MVIMKAYLYLVYRHQYYTLVAWIAQPPAAKRLRNGRPRKLGSFPDDDNNCISFPNCPGRFCRPPSLLVIGCRGISLPVEKRPKHEIAHSTPNNAKVMNGWSRKPTFLHAFKSCTVTTSPYYCLSKALQNLLISIYAVTNKCAIFKTRSTLQRSCVGTKRKRLLLIGAAWFVSGNTWHLCVFITY